MIVISPPLGRRSSIWSMMKKARYTASVALIPLRILIFPSCSFVNGKIFTVNRVNGSSLLAKCFLFGVGYSWPMSASRVASICSCHSRCTCSDELSEPTLLVMDLMCSSFSANCFRCLSSSPLNRCGLPASM